MKLTIFLFFLAITQMMAVETYSQSTRISLNLKSVAVKDVLDQIEQKSEFVFLYNSKLINVDRTVSMDLKDQKISEVLDKLFLETGVVYTVVDRQIVLTNKADQASFLELSNSNQQQKSISGKVTDASGGSLPGVSIVVKGTTTGVITDMDGKYTIPKVSENATLQFSFVGMKSLEVAIGNKTNINVTLEEETIGIEEVVAIGYGTMKKSDLTGSVSTVRGSDLAEKSSITVSQALQGTMSGVMVTRSSGDVNAAASIKIRGITTIGNSSPLVIIDGIPGSIDLVNPNDIESISVLKDAASASIYGSRAASGVILITTKRAKEGQLNIGYTYENSIDQPTRVAQFAKAEDYMRTFNELTWNDKNNISGGEYSIYSKDLIDNYSALHAENPDKYPDTDWMGLMLNKSAPRQSHALNLTAGTKNLSTAFSMIYDKTDALYNGRNYDRITMRSNNNITINKFISMQFDFNTFFSVFNSPIYDGDGYYGVSTRPHIAPVYAAVWSDGRIGSGKTGRNDYALLNYGGFNNTKQTISSGKLQLDFTPLEGLKISAVFSPELSFSKNASFKKKLNFTDWDYPNTVAGVIEGAIKTSLDEGRNDSYNLTSQLLSNYIKSLNNHNLNLLLGFEESHYFYETLGASRDQYALTEFPYLDLGNKNYQYNSGSAYENAYRSFFGRILYNFDNKYFLQANARYDGSSRFAKDYRWGLFPSLSAGWVVSKESFMNNFNPLSFLKIRASWGTLGNDRIGNYPYQSTIGFGSTLLYNGNNVVADQTAAITSYAIPNITWETTETYDFGIDANFFNDKLTFTGDFYKKITKDMLLSLAIPLYIGLPNPDQNTGRMNTTGWEFELRYNDKLGNINYSVSCNLSDFKSTMGDLGGTQFLGDQVKYKGSEFNEWYGYKSDGLFQTQEEVNSSPVTSTSVKPGDVKYMDISGPSGIPDGKITAEYDRVLLGGSLPKYMYGGSLNLGYKNFDFSLVFQGIGQQNSLLNINMFQPLGVLWSDVPEIYTNSYWSKYNTDEQNQKAKYPRLSNIGITNNYSFSDFWLFNGAYFRLKNINLGYNIPKNIVEHCKLQKARVYVNISDLFSLDHFPKGWDPETSSYWITRSFTIGGSLTF